MKLLQYAGIGFGEIETYRLQKSLKKLSTDSNASSLRFWGKISGIEKDYYIVEAVVEGDDDAGDGDGDEQKEDIEPKGSGVNKYSYYVSHSSVDSWKKLPDLSPNDIKASRAIKVLFTGNLERYIHTNPFFFG